MAVVQNQGPPEELRRTLSIRPVDIALPHSLGFIGAVGVAAALELIPIPIAIFVSGVPYVKQPSRSNTPNGRKPVGDGAGDHTVR